MVLGLISLISNFISWFAILVLAVSAGCSTFKPKKSTAEETIELAEDLGHISKKVQNIDYGPTKKEGTTFLDRTSDYGLMGLSAVSFNAVDLNNDGHTDLVILPTFYS